MKGNQTLLLIKSHYNKQNNPSKKKITNQVFHLKFFNSSREDSKVLSRTSKDLISPSVRTGTDSIEDILLRI